MKSKCCNAEVGCGGGGYDGEDICPVYNHCEECGKHLTDDEIVFEEKDKKEKINVPF